MPAKNDSAYILPTLEGFRNKLLDLTTRNKLLNLGLKSQRTARLLRFVDTNLQTVLDGLSNGRKYSLCGLPELPKEKQPEIDDEEIEAALVQARANDPLYQQVLADGDDDEATKVALAQADERLRTTVLEELGKAVKNLQSAKNLAAWAEKQGINPSYSLSLKKEKKQKSSRIQFRQDLCEILHKPRDPRRPL